MIRENNVRINGIVILIVIILILGTIFALQVAGVIKPSEKQTDKNATMNTTTNTRDENNTYKSYETIIKERERNAVIRTIFTLIITVGLNIGICKLYSKLSLPGYIVTFNFIWPLLAIFNNMLPSGVQLFTSLIYSALGIMTLWYYFRSLEMSGWWAILPFGSMLLLGFGVSLMLFGGGSFLGYLGLGGMVAFVIAYILSNIKLAQHFDKSTGFTVRISGTTVYIPADIGISKRLDKIILTKNKA